MERRITYGDKAGRREACGKFAVVHCCQRHGVRRVPPIRDLIAALGRRFIGPQRGVERLGIGIECGRAAT